MPLRVLMMGTGTFALPAFRAVLDSEHETVALVTQPDRTGRGHHQHVNGLKELALSRAVPVFQPEKVNTPEALDRLREFAADLFLVAAYGQILSRKLLEIPRLGAINLHGSLLPKYRGAAPVQYAVLCGEEESGVTIFQIEPKLDAGPILGVVKTPIGEQETSGELHDRLAELAAPLTLDVLRGLELGTLVPLPQTVGEVTLAPKITKEQGEIDWSRSAQQIACHVRGMQPWPMPFTFLHLPEEPARSPQRISILAVAQLSDAEQPTLAELSHLTPGACRNLGGRLLVKTGDGFIEVVTLQPAGKRAMSAADFLRGTAIETAHFGSA